MNLRDFVAESNRIEGINRPPTDAEIDATIVFLQLERLTVEDVCSLIAAFAYGHRLRDKSGLNVRVGNYYPPPGGPEIRHQLDMLLNDIHTGKLSPYAAHLEYESLHPFTDGNGRSGRAIWLWQMKGDAPLGFLHTFYYQALSEQRA